MATNGCIHAGAAAGDCRSGHDLDGPAAIAVAADSRTVLVGSATSGAVVGLALGTDGSLTQASSVTACAHAAPATGACAERDDLVAPAAIATTAAAGEATWVASRGDGMTATGSSATAQRS